jgi:hypothetical protein
LGIYILRQFGDTHCEGLGNGHVEGGLGITILRGTGDRDFERDSG